MRAIPGFTWFNQPGLCIFPKKDAQAPVGMDEGAGIAVDKPRTCAKWYRCEADFAHPEYYFPADVHGISGCSRKRFL